MADSDEPLKVVQNYKLLVHEIEIFVLKEKQSMYFTLFFL